MFHTGEIRWFFKGSLPDEIREWFESKGQGKQEPSRTDYYLLLPYCDTTSVKLSEGNLEVKASTRRPEAVTYTNEVSGYRDAWVKWSSKADDIDALTEMLGATGDAWATIRKSRYLRKYSLDGVSPVEVNAATARPESACQVEISSLSVLTGKLDFPVSDTHWAAASPWWSIALEASAPGAAGVDVTSPLNDAADHFFRNKPPHRLSASSSMSYPAWLLKIA